MEIILSKKFIKEAKKLVESRPKLKEKINKCIIDFSKLGKKSVFYRKKLHGNLLRFEELEIGGDLRIFAIINKEENKAVFERIGTHSSLGI